jgi:hypothetical protein
MWKTGDSTMKDKFKTTAVVIVAIMFAGLCLRAQNVAINDDGALPNSNAMLDVKSPATGNGRGLLIPRITDAQMTSASSALPGGLLDDSGNLRGGPAQGLLVYRTDGTEGFCYNISTTATPSWVYLGSGDGTVTSVVAGPDLPAEQ